MYDRRSMTYILSATIQQPFITNSTDKYDKEPILMTVRGQFRTLDGNSDGNIYYQSCSFSLFIHR